MTSVEWRFGRFSLVGLMGAILQVLLISLLTKYFGVPPVAATAVAVEITVLHNFIWHERFTWGDRTQRGSRQLALRLWRFHAANGLISVAGNTMLMCSLVERLKAPTVPAAIGGIVLCSLVNFLVAERWVYTNALRSATLSKPFTAKALTKRAHRIEAAGNGRRCCLPDSEPLSR